MHPYYTHIRQELSGYYADNEASAMAKWILTDVFNLSTLDLYAGKDINFSAEMTSRAADILERLKRYEPLQYIIGETTFDGLSFEVTPAVLIPRPETVELVDWIVADNPQCGLRVLDIGTGSGCIPVSLAKRLNSPSVSAWDISAEALKVARRNASRNGVEVCFSQIDVLKPIALASTVVSAHSAEGNSFMTPSSLPAGFQVDVLVSNPPYIGEGEKKTMERNVLDWEPELALFVPDDDPLIFYRRIAEIGLDVLSPKGVLYYEINQLYGPETISLLEEKGYKNIELRKDLSANDRMVKAVRP